MSETYRLTRELAGLIRYGDHMRITHLPAGAVVLAGSEPNESGLVDALCEGELVLVFAQDLRESCARVQDPDKSRRAVVGDAS